MQDHSRVSVGRGRVEFTRVSGEVIAVERWSETQVESSSGTVRALGDSVYITPPAITAWSEAKQRLWVRLGDGSEVSVPVPASVEARAGHAVELVLATEKSQKKGKSQWCALWNKTATKWWRLDKFPPCKIYGVWTSIWLGLLQGTGGSFPGFLFVLLMMSIPVAIPVGYFGGFKNDWKHSPLDGVGLVVMISGGLLVATLIYGAIQSKWAEKRYKKAVARYVDTIP